ncbi:MAG: UbiA family prenyltransferase [Microbacteriaceae bacterium]|nr:UbiA family prenyltransferase [Microbacteriaceae bacterium]MDR9444435.1 UbiA family prenyltransferase [Microbacteriaceae bacterium]
MLSRLVVISRPVLWVNTIGPAVMAMWIGGELFNPEIIPLLIWLTVPFNLWLYGINDIFDRETDLLNARKGGVQGAVLAVSEIKWVLWGIAITNIPFLIYFFLNYSLVANIWIVVYYLFFLNYSAPPLRWKSKPFWDAGSNIDYAFPLVFVALALNYEVNWIGAIGLMLWGVAKQAYDAIQDIYEDRAVGIETTATKLDIKGTVIWSTVFWSIATVMFLIVNIPLGIANGIYVGYLLYNQYKKPTLDEARRLYPASIAFPYIVGTVIGFQLVVGLVFGLYP